MTVIAVKDNVMAADGIESANGLQYPVSDPKITRAPDGSLVGGSGGNLGLEDLRKWVLAGMDFDAAPVKEVTDEDDLNRIAWLWLKPTGELRFGDHTYRTYRCSQPYTAGYVNACNFVEGAMRAGLSAQAAVELATQWCAHIRGPVQAERVDA